MSAREYSGVAGGARLRLEDASPARRFRWGDITALAIGLVLSFAGTVWLVEWLTT